MLSSWLCVLGSTVFLGLNLGPNPYNIMNKIIKIRPTGANIIYIK
jgi:hypothetical protein